MAEMLTFPKQAEPERPPRTETGVEAKANVDYAARLDAFQSAVIKRELSQLPEDATPREKDIVIEEAMRLAEVERVVSFYDALAKYEQEAVEPGKQEGKFEAIGFVEEKLGKMGNLNLWFEQAAKSIPDAVPHIARILDLALATEPEGLTRN